MIENETEQTEETQVEETQEVQVEETEQTEQTEETEKTEETKESFVDKWKGIIKDRLSGGGEEEDAGMTDVPDEFTKVVRALNWSDEDTIEFTKEYTNEQLLEMIPSLIGADPAQADDPAKADPPVVEPVVPEVTVEDSQEDDKLTQALADIADLKERLGARDEQTAEEEQAGFNQRASDLFDKASEEFEVFGKTDDLPKFPDGRLIPTSPQMKARLEVYGRAQQLKEAGIPGDEALDLSLNAYKGANLSVETKRNVIKDLKKREQTLGGKRVSHEVVETGDLTGPQILQAVARKHGKELPM